MRAKDIHPKKGNHGHLNMESSQKNEITCLIRFWMHCNTCPPMPPTFYFKKGVDLLWLGPVWQYFTLPHRVQVDSTGLQVIFQSPPGVHLNYTLTCIFILNIPGVQVNST